MTVEELQVVISVKMEKIDAKINNLIKKCDSLGANATKAGKGTDKLSDACTKLKDRAEAGSAGTQKLSGSLKALKAGAAVAAITAVTKAVKRLTDAYAETQAAQVGLESILAAQGKDVSQAKAWLQEYTKDGLIPLADAYTAYKNLSSAGYADDQTQSVLQNLKDSAAFARQGSLTMGEAVKSATEGIKNENSILVDNAGVTKNLSVIWEEYAASIGKGVGSLTAAEKRLATVEGLMRETAFQTGDAARYASTFAGAQAALKAQTKQLSSALGSIFAPAMQAALPYLTALAEKMTVLATRAGQVMAALFGIKPTPIKQLSASTQTVSAGLEKATKKAKELKGQLLGIDELNVIEKADTGDSSGSDTTGSTGGMSTGIPINSALSNADNVIDPRITARAEEIREKLREVKDLIQTYSPAIKGVAAVGAAAFGAAKISKWFGLAKAAVGKSPLLSKGVKALGKSLLYAKTSFAITRNPLKGLANGFSSLWSSFKHFMGGLNPMVKMGVGLAALGGEVVVVKNAVEEYALGNLSLKDALLQIGPTAAAAGGVMYATFGPPGLVVAAVAGLDAALLGACEAEQALATEAAKSIFYKDDAAAVNVSLVADAYKRVAENMSAYTTEIQSSAETRAQADDQIEASTKKIEGLSLSILTAKGDISESVAAMSAEFETLKNSVNTKLDAVQTILVTTFVNTPEEVLKKFGVTADELTTEVVAAVSGTKKEFVEAVDDLEEALENLRSNQSSQVFKDKFKSAFDEVTRLSGYGSESIDEFQGKLKKYENYNFEGPKEAANALKQISESYSKAMTSFDEMEEASYQSIEDLKGKLPPAMRELMKSIVSESASVQKEELSKQTADLVQSIYNSAYKKAAEAAKQIDIGFFTRIISGTKVPMVNAFEDILDEIDQEIGVKFPELFKQWGYSSADEFSSALESSAKAARDSIWKSSKGITQSAADGISSGQKELTKAVNNSFTKVTDQIQNSFSYNRFNKIGRDASNGLTDAFRDLSFPRIKTPHYELDYDTWGAEGEAWRQMGLQGRPSVNVKWYAKGGVFTDRSLIGVGEYPGAASNPEIATPQSIMRDTVAGVLQSDRSNQYDVIYRAVYAAISALGPDLFSPEVVVDLDGRNLGRGSAKYVKQELIRSGEW